MKEKKKRGKKGKKKKKKKRMMKTPLKKRKNNIKGSYPARASSGLIRLGYPAAAPPFAKGGAGYSK
jgi:hypothetical protein